MGRMSRWYARKRRTNDSWAAVNGWKHAGSVFSPRGDRCILVKTCGGSAMSEIRVVATGLRFPEGPVAMKDGSVVLVEIERQTVTRVHPNGLTEVIAHTGGGPNGLAVGPDGAFYVCNNGGFQWRLAPNPTRAAGPASGFTR